MRFRMIFAASVATALMCATSIAMADDWVATKLRGRVLQLVDNEWQPLGRGDIVSDDRVVRTIKGARVTFQRGNETIDLGGDTQIQIRDKSGRQFTTVQQYFGTVSIEADVRQVEHFSVTTPQLAAVVKGTRFTVVSNEKGAKVSVQRGHVEVEDRDTHQSTLLAVGQSAQTSNGTPLAVAGKGQLPTVYAANGKPVNPDAAKPAKASDQPQSPKAAAAAAREAALAAGASKREADQAAKTAEKEAKAEAKAAEKQAAAAAYQQAIANGASPKQAEREAKEAAKDAKEESKTAEKEARAEEKAAELAGKSESKGGDNGNSGKSSDSGNSGKGSDSSDSGKGHGKSDDGGGSGNGNGNSGGNAGGSSGGSGSDSGNANGGGGGGSSDSGGGGGGTSSSGGDSGGGGGGGGNGHGGGGDGGGKKDKD